MFIQVAKLKMFHHLTAEARKGYGSIISWVFLACLISCGQEQPVRGGGGLGGGPTTAVNQSFG